MNEPNAQQLQLPAQRKVLRRDFSRTGWILLIYYAIMNASVSLAAVAEIFIRLTQRLASGEPGELPELFTQALSSGWGYLLAVAAGTLILLLWKKPRYVRTEIFARGKPMTPGRFFAILCVFMSCQFLIQLLMLLIELLLNTFGCSIIAGMNAVSVNTDSFSMLLYAGIFAPIAEEVLFRGLIQRGLRPYGRNFAIVCSAFVFGLYHGNLLQSFYAFGVGLVLGYVASEYSIVWAMVLHMFNNLIIGDTLQRLTAPMPGSSGDILFALLMLAFAVAALVILIANRRRIRDYLRCEPVAPEYLRCFFSSPGILVLTILMGISIVFTFFAMLRPL